MEEILEFALIGAAVLVVGGFLVVFLYRASRAFAYIVGGILILGFFGYIATSCFDCFEDVFGLINLPQIAHILRL